jgi:hypothetical protein
MQLTPLCVEGDQAFFGNWKLRQCVPELEGGAANVGKRWALKLDLGYLK